MFDRPTPTALRAQIKNRLSTFEQARAMRACRDIRELLATVTCSQCGDTAPNVAIARAAGFDEHQVCASCQACNSDADGARLQAG